MLLFLVSSKFILDWLFVLEHLFFSNLALGDGHVDIHYMNWRINDLGLHHRWFFHSFHSFLLKHILRVIEFRTIYNPMFNLIANMIGIPHRFLYSNLLNGNLRNYKNKLFFSFDSTCFKLWFVLWQFIQYICIFFVNV